jgi:pimeloyl-ACP methyl ester carboxylesterase
VTPAVDLTAGTIDYLDSGGDGPVLVLLHGLAMDGRVWDDVVTSLGDGYRCVRPTQPFGSHRHPMGPDADLSLRGQGRIVAELIDKLGLENVTLVFNDWGGAQTMIADGLMGRVGRLVLTPCEAFENYPPGIPGRIAALSGRLPGGLAIMYRTLKFSPTRRLPFVYGRMSKRGVPDPVMRSWLEPFARPEIRNDVRRYVITSGQGRREMLAATPALAAFEQPVLVLWGPDDKMMRPANGKRLADAFPNAKLVEVPDSYVLMPIDQPEVVARELRAFVTGSAQASTPALRATSRRSSGSPAP